MKKSIITIVLLVIALFIAIKFKNFIKNNPAPEPNLPVQNDDETVFCTKDAMMCPDGTYVGRTGTKCEFKCPEVVATTTINSTVILGLNETFEINGLIIKPWAVTQDSRCPSDVTCIQAGKVVVAINLGTSTMEIEPGQIKHAGAFSVTLDDVMPYPISTHKITDQEYKFTFTFKNN